MEPHRTGGEEPDQATLDLGGRCVGGTYLLVRPIGEGATGTVWSGVDRTTGEPVAVKLLHESLVRQPKLVTRFVQERTILLMLRHRNVVRVRDLFSVGATLGLVMDLVGGGTLRGHLREHGPLAPAEAARLAGQVAAALAEAHQLGVVHRDLKPDNILLQRDGGRPAVRLTDFGIARMLSAPGITSTGAVVGTPHYLAPEAFSGAPADPSADVYALGVLLYELVSGRPPYHAATAPELMRRHLDGDPARRPGVPAGLWSVIRACMARRPQDRPAASGLAARLDDLAGELTGVPALPPPPPDPPAPPDGPAPGPRAGAHPSQLLPAPRAPRRGNQAPVWRWVRRGALTVLVAGVAATAALAAAGWPGRAGDPPAGPSAARAHRPATPPPARPSAGPAAPERGTGRGGGPASSRRAVAPAATAPAAVAPRRPAGADASGGGPAAGTPAAPERPGAGAAGPATAAPPERTEQTRCGRVLRYEADTPVLAQPCHAVGDAVLVHGVLTAPSDGRASVTLELRDAAGGTRVGASRSCGDLVFTADAYSRDCGPLAADPPRGRRYVVRMTYAYTRHGRTVHGTATGEAFAW